jgi:hypothetical protein
MFASPSATSARKRIELKGHRPEEEEEKKDLIACRGLGRVAGPLLAARALPLRCAASTVLSHLENCQIC